MSERRVRRQWRTGIDRTRSCFRPPMTFDLPRRIRQSHDRLRSFQHVQIGVNEVRGKERRGTLPRNYFYQTRLPRDTWRTQTDLPSSLHPQGISLVLTSAAADPVRTDASRKQRSREHRGITPRADGRANRQAGRQAGKAGEHGGGRTGTSNRVHPVTNRRRGHLLLYGFAYGTIELAAFRRLLISPFSRRWTGRKIGSGRKCVVFDGRARIRDAFGRALIRARQRTHVRRPAGRLRALRVHIYRVPRASTGSFRDCKRKRGDQNDERNRGRLPKIQRDFNES